MIVEFNNLNEILLLYRKNNWLNYFNIVRFLWYSKVENIVRLDSYKASRSQLVAINTFVFFCCKKKIHLFFF